MNIQTEYIKPSIPIRSFDWCAYDGDTYMGEPRDLLGLGETESAAIDDLVRQIEESKMEDVAQ